MINNKSIDKNYLRPLTNSKERKKLLSPENESRKVVEGRRYPRVTDCVNSAHSWFRKSRQFPRWLHIKWLQFSMLPLETKHKHNELECEEEKLLSFYPRCYRRSVIPAPVHSSLVRFARLFVFFFFGHSFGCSFVRLSSIVGWRYCTTTQRLSPGWAGKNFFLSEVVNPVIRQVWRLVIVTKLSGLHFRLVLYSLWPWNNGMLKDS